MPDVGNMGLAQGRRVEQRIEEPPAEGRDKRLLVRPALEFHGQAAPLPPARYLSGSVSKLALQPGEQKVEGPASVDGAGLAGRRIHGHPADRIDRCLLCCHGIP